MVKTAWARMSQSKASKDYLSDQVPGSTTVSNHFSKTFSADAANNHYLAVLSFQVISMDWLELGRDMHRRAHIDASGVVTALVP